MEHFCLSISVYITVLVNFSSENFEILIKLCNFIVAVTTPFEYTYLKIFVKDINYYFMLFLHLKLLIFFIREFLKIELYFGILNKITILFLFKKLESFFI